MIDHPVREGEVLAGKYRVERVLGAGGMGVVVAAHHLQLDERVALKFLLPGAAEHAEVVARFAREARAAAKIKSEHVARVMDVGVLENGAPYLVMEFLAGLDLAAVLEQRGPLPVEEVVEYVLQAGEAIAEAHSLGIVHRDLKPSNLFFARRHDGSPCIKVLDFGISKVMSSSVNDVGMTSTNAVIGSPLYMSPEQMRSAKAVDQRADIWSLGVILYELLAGVPPFTGATVAELVLEVATRAPRPLREHRSDVPPNLDAAVRRCLEKEPEQRFAHVGELAVVLAELAPAGARTSVERILRMTTAPNEVPSILPPPGASSQRPAAGPSTPAGTAGAWGNTQSRAAPKRIRALVLLVAAGGGVAGWFVVGRSGQPEPSATATLAPTRTPAPTATQPTPPPSALAVVTPAVEATGGTPGAAPPLASSASPPQVAKANVPARARKPNESAPRATAVAAPTSTAGLSLDKLDFGGRN